MENSNKTLLWVIVAVIIIAVVAWLMMGRGAEQEVNITPGDTEEQVQDEPIPQTVVVNLSAQNNSGMTGTATLRGMGETTVVEMNVTGGTATPQPAHIHAGACPNPGGIVYPLESLVNGRSTTTVNAILPSILSQLPLAINVHKSQTELSVYLACGNITF